MIKRGIEQRFFFYNACNPTVGVPKSKAKDHSYVFKLYIEIRPYCNANTLFRFDVGARKKMNERSEFLTQG